MVWMVIINLRKLREDGLNFLDVRAAHDAIQGPPLGVHTILPDALLKAHHSYRRR